MNSLMLLYDDHHDHGLGNKIKTIFWSSIVNQNNSNLKGLTRRRFFSISFSCITISSILAFTYKTQQGQKEISVCVKAGLDTMTEN
jgi:hypothetical protein